MRTPTRKHRHAADSPRNPSVARRKVGLLAVLAGMDSSAVPLTGYQTGRPLAAVHILRLTVRASSSERKVHVKLSQCAIYRIAIRHRVQPVDLVWRNANSASNWSWRSVNFAR